MLFKILLLLPIKYVIIAIIKFFRYAGRHPRRVLQVQGGPFFYVTRCSAVRQFGATSGVRDGEKVQHATG